jgi:hypothetical protein
MQHPRGGQIVQLYVMPSLQSLGLTMGIGAGMHEFASLGDPSGGMFDDGAEMHDYLLCTRIVVVPTGDPKDLFMECVTM